MHVKKVQQHNGWQVTLCDPICYVSSRSSDGRPVCKLYLDAPFTFTFYNI